MIKQEARPEFKTHYRSNQPRNQTPEPPPWSASPLFVGVSCFSQASELKTGERDGFVDDSGMDFAGLETPEQIQETSRLVSIGELTCGVAHEINNPLSIVAGFAELMMDCPLPHPYEDYVQKIYVESHRAARIVRNFLEYSRKTEPRREVKSLQFVIRRALELKQHDFKLNNIEIVTDWPRNLPHTMIYQGQLVQAVVNVLANAEHVLAVHYSQSQHGSSQHPSENSGRITVSARCSAGNVTIKVADNGPGIPKNFLDRIFDPFFTTKSPPDGTGLGLSDCRRILALHGGCIWAESQLGEGSTFCLRIPVIRQ